MLETYHSVRFGDARNLDFIDAGSVDLVVTSPPYPMIEMWDDAFRSMSPPVASALERGDGQRVFELMHRELDTVWTGVYRVLRNDGIVCINVGDAVRSIGGRFSLYPNHARILMACLELGFHALPLLLWRKPTNAPNKFMGSGMLPVGAYVTLEHEYILILRKGGLRSFAGEDKVQNRSGSALFWEERNQWYSDLWDFRGVRQAMGGVEQRERSAAYPFELAYRLICMYSVRGDMVLDPFLGTGTTMFAALAAGRNSIGLEIDRSFQRTVKQRLQTAVSDINSYLSGRIQSHVRFVDGQPGGFFTHRNAYYGFPVKTRQEVKLVVPFVENINASGADHIHVTYRKAHKRGPGSDDHLAL
jgi:DNA modification methylase